MAPKWEERLPKKYVVAATLIPKSLVIKVEIQITDMAEVKSRPDLIDCGATGQFMNHGYSDSKNYPNVLHFLLHGHIASQQGQTEPIYWCM